MSSRLFIRRFAIFFCLAALLLLVLTPAGAVLTLAVLAIFFSFIPISLSVLLLDVDDPLPAQSTLALPLVSLHAHLRRDNSPNIWLT